MSREPCWVQFWLALACVWKAWTQRPNIGKFYDDLTAFIWKCHSSSLWIPLQPSGKQQMGVTDALCCRCSDNKSLNDFEGNEYMFQHLINFYPTCVQSVQFRELNVSLQGCLKCSLYILRGVLCNLLVVTWGLGIWIFWNSAEEADGNSPVSQAYAVLPTSLFSWELGFWLYPRLLGGLRTCPNILIYNPLILEPRLWNLRDVLLFVCSSCEVSGQGVLDAKKGVIQREQHSADGGRLVSSIDRGLKGTSVLLLATPWNPHATICSSRLLTSDGLSVWGEVYIEWEHQYLMSYSEGGNCKTTNKEYALKTIWRAKAGWEVGQEGRSLGL